MDLYNLEIERIRDTKGERQIGLVLSRERESVQVSRVSLAFNKDFQQHQAHHHQHTPEELLQHAAAWPRLVINSIISLNKKNETEQIVRPEDWAAEVHFGVNLHIVALRT